MTPYRHASQDTDVPGKTVTMHRICQKTSGSTTPNMRGRKTNTAIAALTQVAASPFQGAIIGIGTRGSASSKKATKCKATCSEVVMLHPLTLPDSYNKPDYRPTLLPRKIRYESSESLPGSLDMYAGFSLSNYNANSSPLLADINTHYDTARVALRVLT